MEKLKGFVNRIGIYRLAIIILCLFSIIGLFMPYEKSIGTKKDYLKSNLNDYYLEELDLKNKDVINISIVENFKVYNYALNHSDNTWMYEEAILNFIITIILIVSIIALLIATIFKKHILAIVFDIVMAISSLIMNADIVSRGVIPSGSYTYGIAYYLFIIFSILILVLSIINKKNNRNIAKDIKKRKIQLNKKTALFTICSVMIILLIVIICLSISNGLKGDSSNDSIKGSSLSELKVNAEADEKKLTDDLKKDFEELKDKTDTIEKYKENKDNVKDFYKKIVDNTETFCNRAKEYSIKYLELILNSKKSTYDMYDELDKMYEDIYEGILENVYDDIYEELLENMYKQYYEGILEDAYDSLPYEEYSELKSDEYNNYSTTTSEVYNIYSNTTSDIYKLYSSLKGPLYDDNLDKSKETLNNFVENMK